MKLIHTKHFLFLVLSIFVFIINVQNVFAAAPVLDTTKTPTFVSINEDASAPVGTVGSPVLNLVDFVPPSGGLDNVSDADGGAVTGIAVIAINSNFSCFYSINSGASWLPIASVSAASARLLGASAPNRIYCQPNADISGSFTDVITFRAWDQTSGTDGGIADTTANGNDTAFSTATDIASITVTASNDAPTATNLSAAESYTEDTPLNLINIVVTDIDNSSVTATLVLSTPVAGSLSTGVSGAVTSTYNAGTGVWSASGALADVNTLLAGLTFTPETGYISPFTIGTNVSDGALSVNGTKAMTGSEAEPADITSPETIILNTSASSIESLDAEFTFISNEDPSTFECKIDAGSFTACTSPFNTPTLSIGEHVFSVRAIDESLNTDSTPAQYTWYVYGSIPDVIERFPEFESEDAAINTPIIFTFSETVSEDLQEHIITEGLFCTDICPTLEGEWSQNDTVLTYTNTTDYGQNQTYEIGLRFDNNTLGALSSVFFTTGTERIEENEPRRRSSGSGKKKVPEALIVPTTSLYSTSFLFTKDLEFGMTHPEVKLLQQYLNTNGFLLTETGAGSINNETDYFGTLTKEALIKFQIANNISPSIGYFGPITRGVVNK